MKATGSKESNQNADGGSLKRLVRRRDSHCLESIPAKISELSAAAGDAAGPGNPNRITAKTHQQKSAPPAAKNLSAPPPPPGSAPGVHTAPNAKLTDDEERAKDARIGTCG